MGFYQGFPNFSQRSFINNEHESYTFCGMSYETSKNLNLCYLIVEILAKVHIKELFSPKLHLTLTYDCAEQKTITCEAILFSTFVAGNYEYSEACKL